MPPSARPEALTAYLGENASIRMKLFPSPKWRTLDEIKNHPEDQEFGSTCALMPFSKDWTHFDHTPPKIRRTYSKI